ncbi:MAG: hypothetical protein VYB44_06270 [Bacteroidota bacterium]|nr:hypothetical protein [Bacteroidota bacterium]
MISICAFVILAGWYSFYLASNRLRVLQANTAVWPQRYLKLIGWCTFLVAFSLLIWYYGWGAAVAYGLLLSMLMLSLLVTLYPMRIIGKSALAMLFILSLTLELFI